MEFSKLMDGDEKFIAYRKLEGSRASIVFFGGLESDMNTPKASAIYQFCKENDIALVLFDYFGHGRSYGNFYEFTVSDWRRNCTQVISELTKGKQIIIGSSLGGWLMCLTALELPDKVCALIGIGAAPDFTETLIFNKLSTKQKRELQTKGVIDFSENNYQVTKKLIDDGRTNLILNRKTLDISMPIRLLHSIRDELVPYHFSLRLAEKVKSKDVEVYLMKDADHSMSDSRSMKILFQTIRQFVRSK